MTPTSSQQRRKRNLSKGNANPAYNGRQQAEGGCLGELEMNAEGACGAGGAAGGLGTEPEPPRPSSGPY